MFDGKLFRPGKEPERITISVDGNGNVTGISTNGTTSTALGRGGALAVIAVAVALDPAGKLARIAARGAAASGTPEPAAHAANSGSPARLVPSVVVMPCDCRPAASVRPTPPLAPVTRTGPLSNPDDCFVLAVKAVLHPLREIGRAHV